jgi:hypothetical protein
MRKTAAALAILAAAVALLYHDALRLWWMRDDAFHLRQIVSHDAGEILMSSAFWRQLPNPVFTPLLFLSLALDLFLAGPEVPAFYVHQLVVLVGAAIALYFVFRLWLSRGVAAAGALLAIAGRPVCEAAAYLDQRHYIEGLLLASVATILIVTGIRRNTIGLSAAGAVAYFAAMSAKEVYVPLIAILALLPERTLRERVRHLSPAALSVVIYFCWRLAMLGPRFTAYGWTVSARDIVTLPFRALWEMAGPALVVFVVAALAAVLVRSGRARWIAGAGAAAALLPIVPVAFQIEARFVLVAWVLAAFAIASSHRWLVGATLLVALIANRVEWNETMRDARRMSQEARVFVKLTPHETLLDPAIPPAAIREIAWLDTNLLREPPAGSFVYDELPVCEGRIRGILYSWANDRVLRVSDRSFCGKIRDLPLSVRFVYRDGSLRWELAPEGEFRIVLADGAQAFDVPSRAGFRIAAGPTLNLKVRRKTAQGWVTYSSDLAFPLAEGATLEWHR